MTDEPDDGLIDDGILINPHHEGVIFQVLITNYWTGHVRADFPNMDMTKGTRIYLANIFHALGNELVKMP